MTKAIDTTLRLLSKASGLTVADIATAIPRAGIGTVNAWLKGEKMPGRDQIDRIGFKIRRRRNPSHGP